MDAEKCEKKKEHLEMDMKMEKLRIAKEQKCILKPHADIIQNTRMAMKEMKVDKDLLAEEKKELDKVVGDLVNVGHGSKEKLEKIKYILEA
ncbi:putative chloride channel-like protein CLC-g [Hordeum vulgare]|nr:putative chloride channel-like protein CLC-g [Hordeum vulgare]